MNVAELREQIATAQIRKLTLMEKKRENLANQFIASSNANLKKMAREQKEAETANLDKMEATWDSKKNNAKSNDENVKDINKLPLCDCSIPEYNYPKNFLYNDEHKKIMRFYPKKCRCRKADDTYRNNRLNGVVGYISSNSSSTSKDSKKNSGWGIKY